MTSLRRRSKQWLAGLPVFVVGLIFLSGTSELLRAADDMAIAPEPHVVSGLAPGDVLNVRASADAASDDLGDLDEHAGLVDVLEHDGTGKWARIHWEGQDAWIAARYLTPATRATVPGTEIPIGLHCGGTEPFWNVTVNTINTLDLDIAGMISDQRLTVQQGLTSANYPSYPAALIAGADDMSLSLVIRPGRCSDGMSDLTYGWHSDLLLTRPEQPFLMSGCCRTMME